MANDLLLNGYEKQGFNENQIEEIKLGLESGVDVTVYADKKFGEMQMNIIRLGLESGLDAKLDVSSFAKPEIEFAQMNRMKMKIAREIMRKK